ncbi:hypothetical protein B0J11DRAFT_176520 [Dendryphion nanum]|uniref:CST complex subunit Stn1 N-terminal domain-containing protein n=1 Tax=Dendryphion nanum TaxID=256645 RepID=A0A9P9EDQ7_9PLEO|nr:hypothetical protein B0J11DRAFT_176520 [Dendryphion nanum]
MSTRDPPRKYRIYPAYCFRASPTYNAWVKLTVADVQALRSEPEFKAQRIYFHLNHPIRYVRLVGVVVAIDDINAKYTVLTIDDGSGATVEVKIIRLTPEVYDPVESPSNTVLDNVEVISRLGAFEVTVDHHPLDIGTVIKAKCTLSEFRGQKQLELKRVWIVPTTDEEVRAWAETAAFKRDVLSIPWHIDSTLHKKIKKEEKADRRKADENERLRSEHNLKQRIRRKARDEYNMKRNVRLEARRRKEEIIMNAGALI